MVCMSNIRSIRGSIDQHRLMYTVSVIVQDNRKMKKKSTIELQIGK